MSNPQPPATARFYRIAADAVGTLLGVALVLLSVKDGDNTTLAVGGGLVALGASQLHTDLSA